MMPRRNQSPGSERERKRDLGFLVVMEGDLGFSLDDGGQRTNKGQYDVVSVIPKGKLLIFNPFRNNHKRKS
jgi:hypothetical protein